MEFTEGAVMEPVTNEAGTLEQFADGLVDGVDTTTTDFLETPAAKMAARPNEIHQGTITSISVETAKTGTKSFLVNLQSKDTGAAFRFNIYPPADFFNPALWTNGKFSSDALSKESPGINDRGKPKQSPYQRYGATIASTEATVLPNGTYSKFADVQLLRQLATDEGRTIHIATPPVSGEDFGPLLNELVSGVNVVFTLVLEKSEEYGDRLKVGKILSPTVIQQANFDKQYPALYVDQKTGDTKGFLRAWAQ
jgi:hypothetical protein